MLVKYTSAVKLAETRGEEEILLASMCHSKALKKFNDIHKSDILSIYSYF